MEPMHNIIIHLSNLFQKATNEAYPEVGSTPVEIFQSSSDKFGDYQFNSSMKLAKILKSNPREVANKILEKIEHDPIISKLEIAGPGFVNITINPEYISQTVQAMSEDPQLGVETSPTHEKIVVEFSSPNVAKELHVGHLRSTIIGDCLARTFEFMGYNVLRLNHIGDWGTAFGMLIAYLKEQSPKVLTGEEKTDLTHLVSWYKASKKQFDEDPAFKKRAQLEVVSLQSGDPSSLKGWNIICEISRKAYQEIYDLMDIKLIERGESFYNPMLPEVISDLEQKGLIVVSDGAKCVFPEGFKNRENEPLPLMLQKSDGGYGYDTTDMAAMRYRVEVDKAKRIIIVTDAGQSIHFAMIAAASEMAGYLDPQKVRFDHVPFGVVLGPDGKKFKTREGEVERLIDLLYNAINKAREIMKERNPDMDEAELEKIATALGLGAVKYADLSCHRTGDYTFSYDRMLRFEGNTASYLMYSYVRVAGIKRKIGADIDAVRKRGKIHLSHPSEIALGLHLLRFVESLNFVAEELLPNRLTDYLYTLAEKFNAFYRDCQVEGTPEEDSRLLLSELVARTMKEGLHLLGVETVERM
jgi:arginyl-tRNA synthetase